MQDVRALVEYPDWNGTGGLARAFVRPYAARVYYALFDLALLFELFFNRRDRFGFQSSIQRKRSRGQHPVWGRMADW